MKNALIKLAKNRKFRWIGLVLYLAMVAFWVYVLISDNENNYITFVALILWYIIHLVYAMFKAIDKRNGFELDENKLSYILLSSVEFVSELLCLLIGLTLVFMLVSIGVESIIFCILFVVIFTIINLFLSIRISGFFEKKLIK